ncbi:MAG: hypothetical protein ACTSWH_08800 [Promethearchaeota archaeon]
MSDLIIVDITENEKFLLDGSLNLKEITGNGKLVIKNPSQKSRLWNLTCDLKEIVNTTISERELNVGILNPAQEYVEQYEIQNLKEPSLKVVEIFDTDDTTEDKVNNAFLFDYDNKCRLKLILNNPLDLVISNIKLQREIPEFFQEIEIITPKLGVAGLVEDSGSHFLNWDVVSLEGHQIAELEVLCKVNVSDKDQKALGALNVAYLVNNYKLTMLNPEIRGLTDSMSGIDRDEGSQPGMWDCTVEFINESEFQVRLEDVKVFHKITTGSETVVSQTPNRLLNPEQTWEFGFKAESKDVPELSSTIEFTPLFVLITRLVGEINKESTIYNVLSATVDKLINPPEVDAYANTDMTISNNIVNNGTSQVDTIIVTDEIPADFIPPLLSQIKIMLGDIDISSRTDFTRKFEINPDDQSPDTMHIINIELFNLASEFNSGKKLELIYPLKARNPRPPTETRYMTPIKVEINSPVEGKIFTKMPVVDPEIKIKYVKRKLKTLKSIKPGVTEGEFSISVRIQNKGNVELENILIKEKIPQGFELVEINLNSYDLVAGEDGSELHIKLDELKGNDSTAINYSCSGQGEYPRYEPEVIVMGRETSEGSTKSESSESNAIDGAVSTISQEKKALLNDLFREIFKKVDQTVKGNDFGNFIEDMKDEFPPGPILHQFMQFAKEIKTTAAEKVIVGPLRDEVLSRLNEFKDTYA